MRDDDNKTNDQLLHQVAMAALVMMTILVIVVLFWR